MSISDSHYHCGGRCGEASLSRVDCDANLEMCTVETSLSIFTDAATMMSGVGSHLSRYSADKDIGLFMTAIIMNPLRTDAGDMNPLDYTWSHRKSVSTPSLTVGKCTLDSLRYISRTLSACT